MKEARFALAVTVPFGIDTVDQMAEVATVIREARDRLAESNIAAVITDDVVNSGEALPAQPAAPVRRKRRTKAEMASANDAPGPKTNPVSEPSVTAEPAPPSAGNIAIPEALANTAWGKQMAERNAQIAG